MVFESDLVMSGPTVINSVLKQAAARSRKFYDAPPSSTNMGYCVILILTDGIVNDLQSTQELVRSYGTLQLPLSVLGELFLFCHHHLFFILSHLDIYLLPSLLDVGCASGWNWTC